MGTGRFPGYGWAILAGILAAIVTDIMHFVFTIGFRRGMTEALSQYDDLRMIGPLLELHSAGSERKELEEELLIRLLRRVQASDSALLPPSNRFRMYRELEGSYSRLLGREVSVLFLQAILKALEQIGDQKALPYVEKAAESALLEPVRQAAKECLPALRERAERLSMGNDLLRPASSDTMPAQDLLRPLQANNTPETEQLLRIAETDRTG